MLQKLVGAQGLLQHTICVRHGREGQDKGACLHTQNLSGTGIGADEINA